MKNLRLAFTALLALALLAPSAPAQELSVAAAADLKFALQQVAAQFQKHTGARVEVSYGSSGNFFAQLQNGAPFDIFFLRGYRLSAQAGSRWPHRTWHAL